MNTRLYEIKIPFIGFETIQIEVEEDNKSDDDTYEDIATNLAQDKVWDKIKKLERIEFFSHVEGSWDGRYPELIFKQKIKLLEIDNEGDNEENE